MEQTTTQAGADLMRLLELPEVTTKERKEKRKAMPPNFDLLKPQQREAMDGLIAFLNEPESGMAILEGYAGTGKTFTMSMFMEHVLTTARKRIAGTATTNKAVKVVKDMSEFTHHNLEYKTIHSLLGLREKIDGYGKISFVQDNKDRCSIGEYNVVIIDEVSQLNDELFALIEPYLHQMRLKIVFIGDPCQIPPVGKNECIPLDAAMQQKYHIRRFLLTEVQRQSADNPIIALSMRIRNAVARPNVLPTRENAYNPENMEGIFFFGPDDKPFVWQLLETYFKSDNFKEDADFMKVVAWTNRTVNTFNRLIRKMIYGDNIPKLMEGEKLIANKPILDEDNGSVIVFTTNDEFEVVSYVTKTGNYKGAELKFYETKVVSKMVGNDENILSEGENSGLKTIRIIHEDSQQDFDMILAYLKEQALAEKKGSFQAADKWKDFYAFAEIFADVNYNYAITAHKSQGSTYENVLVMESDMQNNKKVMERNRILYTAVTRPRRRLFIA